MASTRLYGTIAVVGVASLMGQSGVALFASVGLPIDKLVDAAFEHHERAKRKKLRTLCGCIADELARLVPGDEGTQKSVEIAAAKILDTHGPTDRVFVETYRLDANEVVLDLMEKADLGPLDRHEIGEAIKQVLICFYERLPEQHELFADLLPHTHRTLLQSTQSILTGVGEQGRKLDRIPALLEDQSQFLGDRIDRLGKQSLAAVEERYKGELAAKDQAIEALQAALGALTENARKNPEDSTLEEALERAAVGDLDDAEAVFEEILERKSISYREKSAEADADRLEAADAARHLGALSMLDNVEKALAAYQRAAELDPADFSTWIFLARLHQSAGSLNNALNAAEKAQSVTQDERNTSVAFNEIGNVRVTQGDLEGAVRAYEAFLGIAEELAGRDPGNTDWQRDLAVSHEKIGDARVAQGDLAGAVSAYEASHGIAEELAERDPGNSEWQRDLSVSHNKIGDVLVAQGDLAGAVRAYEAGLGIAEELAVRDPGNTVWQRDLSVSHNKIGDVRVAQGDRDGAELVYEAGLGIREKLAGRDPGNREWQRDLIVSQWRLASVAQKKGDNVIALVRYQKALAIVMELEETNRLQPRDSRMRAELERRIAELV